MRPLFVLEEVEHVAGSVAHLSFAIVPATGS